MRRRLQHSGLSARRSLLGLPLMQNHRHLRHKWSDERRVWVAEWSEGVFTDESRICLQHHDGRIRGGIGYHSHSPLVRIVGTLNRQRYISEVLESIVLPYLQGLATVIFQQDNARPHVARIVQMFFFNHQIKLLSWSSCSPDFSPIENMWSMVAQRLTQITTSAATPDQLLQHVETTWSAVPQEHIQSLFESILRRVTAMNSNNGGYSGYRFWQEPHLTEVYKFNHLILNQHVIYKIKFVVLSLVFLGVAFMVTSSVRKIKLPT
ncbi:transposable element Tcb1 transposase [Trichonephila clavipes]|nr:transposable element Tcb1 transposase [Trichonephila clavipes]